MKSLELTIPKPFVFVLMPFDPQFDDVYTFGIKGAAQDVGAYAERVDRQIFQHSVLEQVFNQINKADVIVADMTGHNTNVFYEVGYAHGLGKTVLLLTQDPSDIPFDLQHKQHIVYGGKIEKLRTNLRRNLNWAISESMARSATGAAGRLEVTIDGVEVPDAATMAPAALINKTLDAERFQVYVRLQNNSEAAIPPITHLYLFAAGDSKFVPYFLDTHKETRQVPVTTNTFGAEVGSQFQTTYQPTEVDIEVPVALRAVSLLSDDASVGLSQQFRIKTVVPTIPPWASEEFELGFMLPGGITETESLLQLRIHSLPAMEGRSPRPVVPGRRQAVKQGRRAKRQRPCCKLHPSAVEPFVGVLRSLRRACDGVAKRHGRRAAGGQWQSRWRVDFGDWDVPKSITR